jgi:hypothetical protein
MRIIDKSTGPGVAFGELLGGDVFRSLPDDGTLIMKLTQPTWGDIFTPPQSDRTRNDRVVAVRLCDGFPIGEDVLRESSAVYPVAGGFVKEDA